MTGIRTNRGKAFWYCAAAAMLAGVYGAGYLITPPVTRSVSVECPSKPVNLAGLSRIQPGRPGTVGTSLVCAQLHGAVLVQAGLQGVDLRGADLSHADLVQAELTGADLRGADLSHARLTQAELTGADLRGADLSHADLDQTQLGRANLRGANLDFADLTQAELAKADLRGASLWCVFAMQAGGTGSVRIDAVSRGVIQVTDLLLAVVAVLAVTWWRRKIASVIGREQTTTQRIRQVMPRCAAIIVAVTGIYALSCGAVRGANYLLQLLPLWTADPGPLGSLGLGNLFSQIGVGLLTCAVGLKAFALLGKRPPATGPGHGRGTPRAVPADGALLDLSADRPPMDFPNDGYDNRPIT
jgi:hypothetical protein